jgi:4-amino-4-deoxy-L-arabinose transferase-like glycosyltransferase
MWAIIPLSELAGWSHMLEVIRLMALTATLSTGLMLAWLARQLVKDPLFSAFAALIYITLADLLFYRGWLAYVDPLYSFFIFSAIALLWSGTLRNKLIPVAAGLTLLTCAFLVKTFTSYVFYGVVLAALACQKEHRTFLFNPRVILLHAAAFFFPLLWYKLFLGSGGSGQGHFMLWEVTDKFSELNLKDYALTLASYPFEVLARLFPAAPVALYLWFTNRRKVMDAPNWWNVALISCMISILPYWFAPTSAARYLMPLYPLFALSLAWPIWRAGEPAIALTCKALTGMIALQWALTLVIFPYYQHHFRGENYSTTATEILREAGQMPLYVTDASAAGMSVVAYIDSTIHPRPALKAPPTQWENGFLISYENSPKLGTLYREYKLGGDHMYLLCRGTACQGLATQQKMDKQ